MAPTMRTRFLLAALLLCVPYGLLAQTPAPSKPTLPTSRPPIGGSPHAKEGPSPWAEFADYTLTVKAPPKGDTGTWKFRTFEDAGDVVIDLDTPGPKGRTKGTMMLVGGQAIAVKGFTPEPGFELDTLDAAILNLKILTSLLDAALPGGPSALKGKQVLTARDEKMPVVASTPTATARFNAPWALQGSVERVDAGNISFQLELDVPGGDKPADRARWTLSGTAGGSLKGRVLDNKTGLAGWTAYTIGPASDARKSHATLKFGTTKLESFATLEDLRAFLAKPAPAPSAKPPATK
jgi:hypothetical protein